MCIRDSIGIGRSSSNRPSRNSSICYRGRTQCNLENTNNPFNSKTAFNTRIYFNPRRSIINSNKSSKNSVFENYANMICSGKSIEKTDRSALRAIHTAFTRPKRSCIEGEERLVRSRNKLVKNRSDDAYYPYTRSKMEIVERERLMKPVFSIFIRKSYHAKRSIVNFK
eukprot:TRINITY_DN14950_c0_g1_i3.p1 TRINITY_DN14950_c0_g1~~TRINITY_DN14950_c0_g1_i3.p1  ORF type:complete len:168 (-),score=7.17 TRINITY_DN14950_c0_g1_i3:57-560(-)